MKSTDTPINENQFLTSHEVGALLQVNPSSVNKWIRDGRIVAFRTPGGHRRIRASDLVTFLAAHKMPIPHALSISVKRRLLVVDDDPKMLRAVRRWFKSHAHGVQVEVATHGVDALVQVGSFKPHLVLLDIFIPEVDGLEVCRRLKANPETRSIAVVVTSGRLTRALEESAREAGAARCLPKPIDFALVLDELGAPMHSAA